MAAAAGELAAGFGGACGTTEARHDESLLKAYEPVGMPGERRYDLLECVREYGAALAS